MNEQHPILNTTDPAASPPAPVVLAATKGQQAGYAIYGAPCPVCYPGGIAADNPLQWEWLNKAGRHQCRRCKTNLILTHPDFPEVTGG